MSGDSHAAIMAVCRDKVDGQASDGDCYGEGMLTRLTLACVRLIECCFLAKPDDDFKPALSDS
ncbi:hypothetical protein MCOR02_001449 [Pyricularia oryzae]|uniref:Uncharacterized protein n=1 Tax=Pyricularia oryzae TaxID=318829 RepID=A0A4P7MZS0_PYROR|nr:hypothetical protein MCOR02_001449 [Pyricularia oryzae]KAI6253190.1 hypothetical protein MCOR19_010245 [Pyricularia oryzae]KAI6450009.1 hypothetical protein MCOR17_010044 [Pyricularia oryzae]KAI6453113.1 hypothetical protein MCOR15_008698 [Pyricularia oryzae]KAI6518043.1 hypothetical protein MCOR16_009175 [Pyricularia oryzae]